MGLSVAYGLFYDTSPAQIFEAFAMFVQKDSWLVRIGPDEEARIDLHEQESGWTVLELGRRWSWRQDLQHEAPIFISEILSCSGFFVRVNDGDYWQYDLFRNGELLDHFVQEAGSEWGPPGEGGDAHAIVAEFPFLKVEDVAPYLIQARRDNQEDSRRLSVPVRPGDEFGRYEQCAALDFLRMLGVPVSIIDRSVTLKAPVAEQFWINPYDDRH